MSTVVGGIAALLGEAEVGAYSPDDVLPADVVPISVATMGESPDAIVTVNTYGGGPEPDSSNGWEYPRLQVRVRALNPLDALDLDRAAYDALQAAPGRYPAPLPGGGWLLQDCYALQSDAQPLGEDPNGRHEYVRNYQLTVEAV